MYTYDIFGESFDHLNGRVGPPLNFNFTSFDELYMVIQLAQTRINASSITMQPQENPPQVSFTT